MRQRNFGFRLIYIAIQKMQAICYKVVPQFEWKRVQLVNISTTFHVRVDEWGLYHVIYLCRIHGGEINQQTYKVVPPSYVWWFIIPINYRYNPLINPSYSTYRPTHLTMGHHIVTGGAPPCDVTTGNCPDSWPDGNPDFGLGNCIFNHHCLTVQML